MKSWWVLGTFAFLAGGLSAFGDWTETFEDYQAESSRNHADGSIAGKGYAWHVKPVTDNAGNRHGAYGQVVDSPVHTGSRALAYRSVSGEGDAEGSWMKWIDETEEMHDGRLNLSWWIYPGDDRDWFVDVDGWYWDSGVQTETLFTLTTQHNASAQTIDILREDGSWTETSATIPEETWSQVSVELDFATSPDQVRLFLGEASGWSDWYTLGSDTEYFRSLGFRAPSEADQTSFYVDDIKIMPIPEPSTLLMLGIGAVMFLGRMRKRS